VADVEKGLDSLYGLPDSEFTAARNDLARELKSDGDAEEAERVRALKKPSRAAAAINRAARAKRKDVKGLLDAADKLGQAQEQLMKGGDRKAMNEAVKRERAAVDKLMAAVEKELASGGKSASMAERARGTLHAVATDPELREELEAGRVTEDREAVGLGPLMAGGGKGKSPARGASSAKRRGEGRKRLKEAERDLEDAERALRRARDEQSEAADRLEAANAAVATAERDRTAAEKARDKARAAAEKA
jgi:hypothetical protein